MKLEELKCFLGASFGSTEREMYKSPAKVASQNQTQDAVATIVTCAITIRQKSENC